MSTDLVLVPGPIESTASEIASTDSRIETQPDVLAAFLAGRNPRTLRAYEGDLADFARHLAGPWGNVLGMDGPEMTRAAVEHLLNCGQGNANGLALAYRNAMLERGLATATICRRLAALRSVVKLARTLGRITWALDVEGPRIEARRDVRGPDALGWKQVWKVAKQAGSGPKPVRDRALLALLFDLALRRAEVVALDLAALDLAEGKLAVVGKGKREAVLLSLPDPTRKALADWVAIRGSEPGPLFTRLDRGAGCGERLTGGGLALMVAAMGRAAKLSRPLRPHGLRHSAITAALDSGCDVRKVRLFSRHAKIETVMKYDDARQDAGGEVAKSVAGKRK